MTRDEFYAFLDEKKIGRNEVSFSPDFSDGYCVRKNRAGWEVFILERGKEYYAVGFPSESDALLYLAREMCINNSQIVQNKH